MVFLTFNTISPYLSVSPSVLGLYLLIKVSVSVQLSVSLVISGNINPPELGPLISGWSQPGFALR